MESKYVVAIVAAAGMGKRMKAGINKQFLTLEGQEILARTLQKIEASPSIDEIIILIQKSDRHYLELILRKQPLSKPYQIVYGGKERQDSIHNALTALPEEATVVLTHDGARPLVKVNKIEEVINGVSMTGAATLATPVKDTIKVSHNGQTVDYTPNRKELFAVQTPQVFYKEVLLKAYAQAYREHYYGTDDCSLVEKTGVKVSMVIDDFSNIKITTPEDLILAEALLRSDI
ncbi:2-C-methyl-D-erythritol 4-phosphate cytidylyltransferase [Peptoniphilus equinus]|nr:2-C-methyl-D-erythritol 4-phosphate cytidylyltransferase [Peptoniphilus equinus]